MGERFGMELKVIERDGQTVNVTVRPGEVLIVLRRGHAPHAMPTCEPGMFELSPLDGMVFPVAFATVPESYLEAIRRMPIAMVEGILDRIEAVDPGEVRLQ